MAEADENVVSRIAPVCLDNMRLSPVLRDGEDYYAAKWSYIDHDGKAVFTYSDQSNRGRSSR